MLDSWTIIVKQNVRVQERMLKNIYHVGEAVLGRVLDKSTRVQVLEKNDKYKYKYCLKGFGWYNVGPASQTVAQHYFTIGPMYRVIRVVAFRGIKRHPHGSQSKHGTITQFCFNVGPASNTINRY